MRQQIRSQDIKLSRSERQELIKQIQKEKERKKADRLRVVLYKNNGLTHQEIAKLLQISINTITKILKRYLQSGINALLAEDNYQGSFCKLTDEKIEILKVELKTTIYHTAAQVIRFIEQKWKIKYKLRGMHKLLRRIGFTYKKNRLVPCKADPKKQLEFVKWFEKFKLTLTPDDRIYFGDAMHLKHNAEVGYAWSLVGEPHLIPSNSGRQRINILGAYCTQTHEHVFIITDENINQDKIIELLIELRAKQGENGKIYLVLDNARYNHAKRVKAQAEESKVTLKYQPPYSPNLNLIERLWKFVRKKFNKDKYRATFAIFVSSLREFLANLDQYRADLVTLLREKFETLPEGWQKPQAS